MSEGGTGISLVRRILIDTDPGLDDLLAIALALASPEIRVEALTTVAGNASVEATTDNALRFLTLAGVELPVGCGAAGPLSLSRVDANEVHGRDGRRGVDLPVAPREPLPPARALLRSTLVERRVDQIVSIGPLTNLAALLREDPALLGAVEVTWMGGTLGKGNATPLAEFNAWADPEALAVLLEGGVRLRVIPLDVTEHVLLRPADVPARPFGQSRLGESLERILRSLMLAERPSHGEPVAVLHDPCAVAAVLSGDLFRYEERSLAVCVEEGRERGRLLERSDGAPVRYAVEAHSSEIARQFLRRLAGWAGSPD